MRTSLLAAALLTGISGCGGGGDGGSPPAATPPPTEAPYGLTAKPGLKGLGFPSIGVATGDVRFVKAFPNLSFTSPLWFGQAPGNGTRAYVVEQGGLIWVFDFNGAVATKTVFLDLTDRTRANGEQGLLGLRPVAQVELDRIVYAYSSKNAGPNVDVGNHTLARFTASADGLTADRASGVVLLNEPDPYQNHNGGSLLFGPDGMLYVADRMKNRVQAFERVPGGARFLREVVVGPGTGLWGAAFDIAFSPCGNFMYVSDGSNNRVWIVAMDSFEVLGWTGSYCDAEGSVNAPAAMNLIHRFAMDPSGNLLLVMPAKGLRVLKFEGIW